MSDIVQEVISGSHEHDSYLEQSTSDAALSFDSAPATPNAPIIASREAEHTSEPLSRIRTDIGELTPAQASRLAATLSSAVEAGADPKPSCAALFECLSIWMEALPSPASVLDDDDDELSPLTPRQEELLEHFPAICLALITHLARLPAERERLAYDFRFLARLDYLQAWTPGATWLRDALLRTSGKLVVLYPPTQQGYKLSFSHVTHCFHLFSLVQTAIGQRLPGGREPNPEVRAACRGQTSRRVHDEAWWHYGDPYCPIATLQGSIWGETLVQTLPIIDGVRVMLLWPKLLASSTWDSGFFEPHLAPFPADIALERALSRDEALAWFQRLGLQDSAAQSL